MIIIWFTNSKHKFGAKVNFDQNSTTIKRLERQKKTPPPANIVVEIKSRINGLVYQFQARSNQSSPFVHLFTVDDDDTTASYKHTLSAVCYVFVCPCVYGVLCTKCTLYCIFEIESKCNSQNAHCTSIALSNRCTCNFILQAMHVKRFT